MTDPRRFTNLSVKLVPLVDGVTPVAERLPDPIPIPVAHKDYVAMMEKCRWVDLDPKGLED